MQCLLKKVVPGNSWNIYRVIRGDGAKFPFFYLTL